MAGEFVASLRPFDLIRETNLGSDPELSLIKSGDFFGLSLPKYTRSNAIIYGYTAVFRIPNNLTMGTGLTFKIYLTDDGSDAGDLGKKAYIGITPKRIASGETTDIDSGAGAESLVSVTLSSTAGGVAIGSLAIAAAALDSLAVGDACGIRLRRKGTDASNDTCGGRVCCLGVEVENT